jgi:hypothetical protein
MDLTAAQLQAKQPAILAALAQGRSDLDALTKEFEQATVLADLQNSPKPTVPPELEKARANVESLALQARVIVDLQIKQRREELHAEIPIDQQAAHAALDDVRQAVEDWNKLAAALNAGAAREQDARARLGAAEGRYSAKLRELDRLELEAEAREREEKNRNGKA